MSELGQKHSLLKCATEDAAIALQACGFARYTALLQTSGLKGVIECP